MSTDHIESKVAEYIVNDSLQGNSAGFHNDTDLLSIAALDSVSLVQLVMFLEATFEIEIDPGELNPSNLRSVNAISKMVRDILFRTQD